MKLKLSQTKPNPQKLYFAYLTDYSYCPEFNFYFLTLFLAPYCLSHNIRN